MCVIITTPGCEARPTAADLRLCELANRHGSGLAWREGKLVRYEKGLTAGEICRALRKVDGPAIVHFRIATVGGQTSQLCHPFPVTHRAELHHTGRARAVLFHNGTWSEYRRAKDHFGLSYGREPVSDSRVAASMVARFGFRWLTRADYCRWAMLDRSGIHRIGQWQQLRGCHYSNLHWTDERPDDDGDDWKQPLLFTP